MRTVVCVPSLHLASGFDTGPSDGAATRLAAPFEGDDMDAIKLFKADHDKVKKLLARLEATTERGIKTRERTLQPRSRPSSPSTRSSRRRSSTRP